MEQAQVLIVEEDRSVAFLWKYALEKKRIYEPQNIHVAHTTEEGLKIYSQNYSQIKLLILDLTIKGVFTDQFYFALREINENLKTLVISGFYPRENLRIILEDDPDNNFFLMKPADVRNIENYVKKLKSIS